MSRAALLIAAAMLLASVAEASRLVHTREYSVDRNGIDETAFPADSETRKIGRSDFSAPVRVVLDFDEWEKSKEEKPMKSMEIDGRDLEGRSFFVGNNGKMREMETVDESEEESAMEDLVELKTEKLTPAANSAKRIHIDISRKAKPSNPEINGVWESEDSDSSDISEDFDSAAVEDSVEKSNILDEWVQRETARLDALTARRYGDQKTLRDDALENWIREEMDTSESSADSDDDESADLEEYDEDLQDSEGEDSVESRLQPAELLKRWDVEAMIRANPSGEAFYRRMHDHIDFLAKSGPEDGSYFNFMKLYVNGKHKAPIAVDMVPRRLSRRDLRRVDVVPNEELKSRKLGNLRQRLEDSDEWDSKESPIRIQKFKFQPIGDIPHFQKQPRPIDTVPRNRIIPTDSISDEIDDDFPKPPEFHPQHPKAKRASEKQKDAAASYERKVTQLTSEEKRLIVERYHESNKRPKGDWFRFGDEPLMRKRHVAAEPKRVDWMGEDTSADRRTPFSVESDIPREAQPSVPEHNHHKHHHHPKRLDKRQSGGLSSPYQITAQYGAMAGTAHKTTNRCYACDGLCDCLAPREEICPSNSRCYTVKSSNDGKIIKKGCARNCGDVNSFEGMCSMCPGTSCNREDSLTHVDTATECERARQRPPPPPVVQPKPVVVAEPQPIEKLPDDDGGFGTGMEKEDDGGFGRGMEKKEPEEPNFVLTAKSTMLIVAVVAALQGFGF